MKQCVILFFVIMMGCKPEASQYVNFIKGYWEIERVTKDDRTIKEFKISTGIDYFKINNNLSGYRKKLKPNFQGTFETSEDALSFQVKIEHNTLYLEYNDNATTYSEEIIKANASVLVIANAEGFVYYYKPYESLNLNE